MPITKEFLQTHIARLRQNIAAFGGALEFAEMLLTRLEMPDEEVHTNQPTNANQEENQALRQDAQE